MSEQEKLLETVADGDEVDDLLERSLEQEDVASILGKLGSEERDLVLARLRELVRKTAALSRAEELDLLELTTALSTELELRPLLVKIMDAAPRFLAAERATLFLHDRKADELWALVGQGERLEQIRFPARAGIAGHVFATRETLSIGDAYADPRFNPEMDTRTGYRTRNILCMPVVNRRSETIGVVQVLNKRGGAFTSLDAKRLAGFSAQAAVAIENSTLFEAYLEKQRADQGLRLAHQIQMSMLPRNFPLRPEVELAARLIPARSVGGDLYDFADQGNCLWFLIADVAGKGVGAALFMAVTKTLFRATIQPEATPSQVISRMNSELCRDNERCLFVTAFLGRLDLQTGELRYSNAGHNRPYRLGRDGSLQSASDGCGMALAISAGESYPEGRLQLIPGEGLYLYTDGVTEALDKGDAEFSLARLEAQLRAAGAAKAHDIVEGTVAAVRAFVGDAPQSDDLTVLALRYGGGAGATP